jgi:hypothetical protein
MGPVAFGPDAPLAKLTVAARTIEPRGVGFFSPSSSVGKRPENLQGFFYFSPNNSEPTWFNI